MNKHFKLILCRRNRKVPLTVQIDRSFFDQYALNEMVLNLSNIWRKLFILNFIQSMYI